MFTLSLSLSARDICLLVYANRTVVSFLKQSFVHRGEPIFDRILFTDRQNNWQKFTDFNLSKSVAFIENSHGRLLYRSVNSRLNDYVMPIESRQHITRAICLFNQQSNGWWWQICGNARNKSFGKLYILHKKFYRVSHK